MNTMVAHSAVRLGRGSRRRLRPSPARGAPLLILIPAYHAGSKYGRFGFLLTCVVASVAFLVSTWLYTDNPTAVRFGLIAWIGAAITLGVLGAWNKRLTDEQETDVDPAAREAIELIQRLQDLSGQMSTGLDAPASASLALDLLSAEVPSTRSAVLVTQDAEHLVPVALRGSTRAPWHIAEHVADLLRTNPASWVPDRGHVHRRARPSPGARRALRPGQRLDDRRRGGAARRQALQRCRAADRPQRDPAHRADPASRSAVRHAAPVRQPRGAQPHRPRHPRRHRPGARRARLPGRRPPGAGRAAWHPMRDGLDGLREQLSEAMADLRMHITDLRVAERPGTGLGAVLGAAVQSFGSVTGVRTTVTVSEGQRRMDPRVEILIHRLVMDILADAQACGARNAWVTPDDVGRRPGLRRRLARRRPEHVAPHVQGPGPGRSGRDTLRAHRAERSHHR